MAAHKAGATQVRARIDAGGSLGPVELVPLDEIYSGKSEIGRWDRGRDFENLVRIMTNPALRDALEPVIVSRVSERMAARLTPVSMVAVNPV